MKKASLLVLAVSISAFVLSCGSAPEAAPPPPSPYTSGLPEWFVNPPDAEDVIYGLGSAKLNLDNLARDAAIGRARTSIAYTIKANVQAMLTDYAKEAGNMNDSSSLQFVESISQQMTDADVSGAKVYKTDKGPDGTWYAAVTLSKKDAAAAAAASLPVESEAAQYAEFKALNALDRMQQQLEKNNVKAEPVSE